MDTRRAITLFAAKYQNKKNNDSYTKYSNYNEGNVLHKKCILESLNHVVDNIVRFVGKVRFFCLRVSVLRCGTGYSFVFEGFVASDVDVWKFTVFNEEYPEAHQNNSDD